MNREGIKKEIASVISHMTPNELIDIKAEAIMQIIDQNTPRFGIDFFEFSFLVEACIPPRAITRSMFWIDVIDKYYWVLEEKERADLYEWIQRNPSYRDGFEKGNADILCFEYRYNPNNQYEIETCFGGKKEVHRAFKWGNSDVFYASTTNHIIYKDITNIKKLSIVL